MTKSHKTLKRCIRLALLLVILEGAIRKWLLPGLNEFVYFAKDGVLAVAYLLAILNPDRSDSGPRREFLLPLLLLVGAIILADTLNPALGSVVVGLFGAKAYLWYIPLLWVAPRGFDSMAEFETWLRRYLLLAIPVCLLGIYQFASPADAPINRYSNTAAEQSVAVFGEEGSRARITGPFPYITGFTTYLTVMLALLLAWMGQGIGGRWFIVGAGIFVLLLGNTYMSGSRAPVFTFALATLAFLISTAGQKAEALRRFRRVLIFAAVAGTGATIYGFRDAAEAFWFRVETTEDTAERLALVNVDNLGDAFQNTHLLGFGTGATHPGGTALRHALHLGPALDPPPDAEMEYLRVMLEIGPIGFVGWYVLRIYLLVALFHTWRAMRIPFLRQVAFAGFFIHAVNLNGGIVINHTMSVYYWFTASFIILLPRLQNLEIVRLRALALGIGPQPRRPAPAVRGIAGPALPRPT